MELEKQVEETIRKYKLCNKKQKILVALSGGKDSTVVAYLLKKFGYNIEGIHIDLKIGKYSEECLKKVKELCENNDIKLHLYDMKKEMGSGMCYIRTTIQSKNVKGRIKNCAICGVIKKWILNRYARKVKGVDMIATGHHLDDESQTFLMNILKGSPKLSANSGAKTQNIKNKKFISRIKPLYYVAEKDIRTYSKKMKLPVNYSGCPCAIDSYRIQIRKFMTELPTKTKENLIKNFEIMSDRIQKNKDTRMKYCENCGEPARKNICKKCELMDKC